MDEEAPPLEPPQARTNPRPIPPDKDPSLQSLAIPEASLVEDLGEVADDLRQLNTDFGLRPYRLFSVVSRWTGGSKGRGTQVLVQETEFLPTPEVANVDRLAGQLGSAGLNEVGTIRVTELSPRLTEDDIRDLFHIQPLPQDQEGWLELRIDRRDGSTTRRRFVVKGAPMRRADEFDWHVKLFEQDVRRSRAGAFQHGQFP